MDISRASNFERFVFDLLDGDPQKVRSCWDELARTGHFALSEFQPLFQSRYGFVAGVSTHADRLATIKSLHERTGVLIDPHTADGVTVAQGFVEPGRPMPVLETARPAKFSEPIQQAPGTPPPVPAPCQDPATIPP